MRLLTRQEELVLLAIHLLQGNSYLIRIRELLIENTGRDWSISSVYVPLDRLTKEEYLKERIGNPTAKRGGKAIKYYQLTDEGMNALAKLKALNETMWKGLEGLAAEV
ncbi:PadR family transcriptional regulator [Bacteroidota bacterium]